MPHAIEFGLAALVVLAACVRDTTGDDDERSGPEPIACAELDEASCLARTDCQAIYLPYGSYPKECEQPNPPDMCNGMGFTGCQSIADGV